ncbi:MAG: cellulase family glycosylhydrolase [Thermogutta sp.]
MATKLPQWFFGDLVPCGVVSILVTAYFGLFSFANGKEVFLSTSLERVKVSADGRGFELTPSGRPFVPWGFNYDHDAQGNLLEDYWHSEWDRVVSDFREMKALGANVVRIHLQVARFLESPNRANEANLRRLKQLFREVEQVGLYLDVTGLGCYHRQDAPAWYDALDEKGRWAAQAFFWETIAQAGAGCPAVFCYDLMNEPVVPVDRRKEGDWLVDAALGGKYFVQRITLDPQGRSRNEIARSWVNRLTAAIRKHDCEALITVGLLPGTKDRADAWSGFVPKELTPPLDFISTHLYPERNAIDASLKVLSQFAVGRPVVVEEIFPLRCSPQELTEFLRASRASAAGWIGFYWGTPPEELRQSGELAAHITAAWLELFQSLTSEFRRP